MKSKESIDETPKKKIRVFILLGQSNMVGMGKVQGETIDGTLEHAVKAKNKYQYLVDDTQMWKEVIDPKVRNFFVMGSGIQKGEVKKNEFLTVQNTNTIGPEIGIGFTLGRWLESKSCCQVQSRGNNYDVDSDTILLLKSCIGNRSLGWDLLPPNSQSFEHTDERTGEKWEYAGYKQSPSRWKAGTDPVPDNSWYAGEQYDGDVRRAKEMLENLSTRTPGTTSVTGYEVVGFFFWQGDKDRYDMAYASRYRQNLIRLIRQLRLEFSSPNAKFVLATLGQTSENFDNSKPDADRLIFDAQMGVPKLPEFVGTVACVYSKPFCHGGASNSHYNHNAETYMDIGLAMGRAMVSLIEDNDSCSKC